MPKNVRIVTSSFATFENTKPPFNIHPPKPDANVKLAKNIIETATSYKPDVIVLPEVFKLAGLPGEMTSEHAEPIPGPTFDLLADLAQKGNTNIIAGHMVRENKKIFNKAIIINRKGELTGSYNKKYPVENEILNSVYPGSSNPVFELDFARVGIAVCFDINWPEIWCKFAEHNIDIAFWISAYEGGFPLQSYAWVYQYPIVSSVWPYHARVIDITGEILCSTSRWSRIVFSELNLDRALFHTDKQMDKIAEIQKEYGERVQLKSFSEEHLILLENYIEGKTIHDIIEEFSLVTYKDYISQCTDFREKYLKSN